MFADTVGYTLIIPVLPTLSQELGLTETWTGLLYASYGLISLVLYLPFGYLVDRVGERFWLTGGMLLLGITALAFSAASGFWEMLACRIAQGVAASATWAATLPLAARLADKNRRGLEMSLVPIAFSLGAIGGPAMGSIGEAREPFVYFSVLPFLLAGLAFFLVPNRVASPQAARSQQVHRPVALQALFSSQLLCACLVILVSCAAIGAIEVLLPLQLVRIGWSRQDVGLLFAAWGAAALVSQPAIGLWSDRRGRQEPMVIGLFAAAGLLPALFLLFNSVWLLPLTLCVIIALSAALAPSMPLIADGLSEGQAGKAFGVYNVAFSIGIVIGPWLGGYVTEQLHVFGAAVLFAVPLLVTASVLPRFLSPAVRLSPELS
jgi:MFS family permease